MPHSQHPLPSNCGETAAVKSGQRMYEVDLLRLFAALMVMFAHYCSSRGAENRFSLAYGDIFHYSDVVQRWAALGPLGVEIFFTISGFVVALSAQGRTARQFLASRLARILPAYWFCCLLTWAVIKLDSGYRDVSLLQLAANLFFVARPLGFEFIDQVYWTIVIEMRFYLLVALFIWAFGFQRYHWFLIAWASAMVLDMLGWLPSPLRFTLFPQYSQNFIAGGALYMMSSGRRNWLATGLLLLCTAVSVVRAQAHIATVRDDLYIASGAVMLATTVLLWMASTGRSNKWGRPWMAVAGALTYPLYLLHEDLGFLFMRHFFGFSDPGAIALLAAVLFLLLSYAVQRFLERPIAPVIRRAILGQGWRQPNRPLVKVAP